MLKYPYKYYNMTSVVSNLKEIKISNTKDSLSYLLIINVNDVLLLPNCFIIVFIFSIINFNFQIFEHLVYEMVSMTCFQNDY